MNGLGELDLELTAGAHPADVQMFTDKGSIAHLLYGMLAGSNLVSPKEALLMFVGFCGYQVSQSQSGEPWSRTGGEFLEFGIGMLTGMFLQHGKSGLFA